MIQMSKNFRKELDLAINILKEAGCREIFIFGSLATGEAKKNSEIDLAVRGCPPDMFFNGNFGEAPSQIETFRQSY